MISLFVLTLVLFFVYHRAKLEDEWREEQRMFWARLRKDLNEVKKRHE